MAETQKFKPKVLNDDEIKERNINGKYRKIL